MKQRYSSKDTSVPQVSRAITHYDRYYGFRKGSTVLDYGGGRYDLAIEYAKKNGFNLYVYDPFWRTSEYNKHSVDMFKKHPDYITCGNVLNVIKEDEIVESVVRKIRNLAKKGTIVVFCMYNKDRTGIGKATSNGWQRNQPDMDYYPLILKYFPNTVYVHNIFIAHV